MLVRDEQTNDIIGGLYGEIFYRWLFIVLLAIPEETRGQGTGSRLTNMAEDVAREKLAALESVSIPLTSKHQLSTNDWFQRFVISMISPHA